MFNTPRGRDATNFSFYFPEWVNVIRYTQCIICYTTYNHCNGSAYVHTFRYGIQTFISFVIYVVKPATRLATYYTTIY